MTLAAFPSMLLLSEELEQPNILGCHFSDPNQLDENHLLQSAMMSSFDYSDLEGIEVNFVFIGTRMTKAKYNSSSS